MKGREEGLEEMREENRKKKSLVNGESRGRSKENIGQDVCLFVMGN